MRTAIVVILLMAFSDSLPACTSAVISGKATADGRPLLWKHRDSEYERNKLRYFKGPSYAFIGVVNSDTLEDQVWMGSNEAGFSIINTATYNQNVGVDCPTDEEGIFMHDALGSCATLAEFEQMLERTNGERGVDANFGVIDAAGGAAYYEVGYRRWKKFDANDPAVAPDGYLLRTNYAVGGDPGHKKGTVRYLTATGIFAREFGARKLSVEFLLLGADDNLEHALLRTDLASGRLPADSVQQDLVLFRDFIVRHSSVSSLIIQGVMKGEDPRLTTLWTVLGWPLTTAATPVWVAGGRSLPRAALSADGSSSPVNERGLTLKRRAFPTWVDNGADYLDRSKIVNKQGTGFAQRVQTIDRATMTRTQELITRFRQKGFSLPDVVRFYAWLDQHIAVSYREQFGL